MKPIISDALVPLDVFSTLMRTGTIKESDIIDEQTYVLADGSKSRSVRFTIRSLKVGDTVVENVKGMVAPSKGDLLLGQSFLQRFKSWSINNTNHELLLEPREKISTQVATAPNPPTSGPNKKTGPVPRWGMQLTSNWSENKAWAEYRLIQKRHAALIGDREPIVIKSLGIGLGFATRYNIRIADDDRAYLEELCRKLIAEGGACVVVRNDRG